MLEITPDKIAQIIVQARGVDDARAAGLRGDPEGLRNYIADLNDDEQAALTAVMWIGRDSFSADELNEAVQTARSGRTTAPEDYLLGEPRLADYLEIGMEALGLSPEDEQESLTRPV